MNGIIQCIVSCDSFLGPYVYEIHLLGMSVAFSFKKKIYFYFIHMGVCLYVCMYMHHDVPGV